MKSVLSLPFRLFALWIIMLFVVWCAADAQSVVLAWRYFLEDDDA